MSAAPLPAPERPSHGDPEPSSQVDEGWALLEGLRRRLDDQAIQGRSTQQQVTQLTESIAALVEMQRRRTRGINLNSFVAYLIFTMLCGAGFYFLYRSRANELVEARDHAVNERDVAMKRADDLAGKQSAREQADTRAWEVYQLLETGKRSEATAKLTALRDLPLSRTERAILAARAHETQVMAVDAAIKAATASFKAGRYQDVIAPLEAALTGEPGGARAASMRYFLGIAYAKSGALDKAVTFLQAALDAGVEHDDARFQLASALDRSGAYARARAEYDRFATAFPQSPFAVYAMRRSATLARGPAIPKPGPAVAPAPAGARPLPVAPPVAPAASPKPVVAPRPNPPAPPPPTTPAVDELEGAGSSAP
jgi:TolA-binding protein